MSFPRLLAALAFAATLSGQSANPPSPDPWMKSWDVDCKPKGCLMFLDIAHGEEKAPDFLTITVALNRDKKDVAFISFIVPDKADKAMGIAIAFANSEKDEKGQWSVKLAEDSTRVLKFEGCSAGNCTARVSKGIIPASEGEPELNLLDQFLHNRMVLFYYWVHGERVRVATTLSGFQSQYPAVIKENLN